MTPPRPKQTVAAQLRDDLLRLLWQKFYADDPDGPAVAAKCFSQDRSRLLGWVILWPARFMSKKGFTVTGERYKQIFSTIILEAVRHGNTTRLGYRPAWLAKVLQSHFEKHWEQYYDEAKGVRAQAEHALHVLGQLPRVQAPNPVEELAAAASLLVRSNKAKQPLFKPSQKDQLTLL